MKFPINITIIIKDDPHVGHVIAHTYEHLRGWYAWEAAQPRQRRVIIQKPHEGRIMDNFDQPERAQQ